MSVPNPCLGCGGKGYRSFRDPEIPAVRHLKGCGQCYGSGRDQSHVEDTLPAETSHSIDTDVLRAACEAAALERDPEARRFRAFQIVVAVPVLLGEIDRLREEVDRVHGRQARG
jgi:hypothetical protein